MKRSSTLETTKEDASQYYAMSSFNIEQGRSTAPDVSKPPSQQSHHSQQEEESNQNNNDEAETANDKLPPSTMQYVLYISVFAVLGSCLRVYLGRLLGEDCEFEHEIDVLMPFYVCVTASGRTEQTGGALFYDLPANLLGSFIMGLLTPKLPNVDKLPFLGKDHPLQNDLTYYTGIGTGLCGSLTTFSAWNTQMIVMMDGNYCELGSQVVAALFGYILGLLGSIQSFHFGRAIAAWYCHNKRKVNNDPPENNNANGGIVTAPTQDADDDDDDDEPPFHPIEDDNNNNANNTSLSSASIVASLDSCCLPAYVIKTIPFVLVLVVIVFYVIGFVVEGIHFYRIMIAKSFTAPIGALLRWKLSSYNSSQPFGEKWSWLPAGTLFANLLASLVSILCLVFQYRFHNQDDVWVETLLFSIRVGFTGCLSTVSTFIKEIVLLSEKYPYHAKPHIYGAGTIFLSIIICLPLYSIIGRVGA